MNIFKFKMAEKTYTAMYGYLGFFIWLGNMLLRGSVLMSNPVARAIAGVLPNLAGAWLFIWIGEIIWKENLKRYGKKEAVITSIVVGVLAVAAEIYMSVYGGGFFDPYDLLMTLAAIVFYLYFFFRHEEKTQLTE